jgi:hypothetical protein
MVDAAKAKCSGHAWVTYPPPNQVKTETATTSDQFCNGLPEQRRNDERRQQQSRHDQLSGERQEFHSFSRA